MRLPKAGSKNVIPAKAGIQNQSKLLDSRLRGSDRWGIIRGAPKYLSRSACNQGLSLIEVMVSLLIITIGIVGFGMAIPVGEGNVEKMKEERIALLLAKQMMEEIKSKAYEDPDLPPNSFGREEGAPREHFDDIDDYDDWYENSPNPPENPPQYADGTILNGENETPNYQEFRRQVVVKNVTDSDYGSIQLDGTTSSKRIRVTVSSINEPKPFDDIVITWVANQEGMALLY